MADHQLSIHAFFPLRQLIGPNGVGLIDNWLFGSQLSMGLEWHPPLMVRLAMLHIRFTIVHPACAFSLGMNFF